jgi:short-subunit dehydrogenase
MTCELNAIVTGASSGIGRAIAIAIAATNGEVLLVGRNSEQLEATAGVARRNARSVEVFRADLSIDDDIRDLARYAERSFNSFNTLVHCAGAYAMGQLEETSVHQLDVLYRVNIRAPYALTQALLPLLRSRQGQIAFINSSQGLRAGANTCAYASTKHALKAFADSLRQQVNADGVRVLSIYPGRTATNVMRTFHEIEGRPYQPQLLLQPEEVAQVVVQALQLTRTAEITDLEIRPLIKTF